MNDWKKPKRMSKQAQHDEANEEMRFEAIEKEADAILEREGAHHVRGCFFPSANDATMARMGEAERIIAKREERVGAGV